MLKCVKVKSPLQWITVKNCTVPKAGETQLLVQCHLQKSSRYTENYMRMKEKKGPQLPYRVKYKCSRNETKILKSLKTFSCSFRIHKWKCISFLKNRGGEKDLKHTLTVWQGRVATCVRMSRNQRRTSVYTTCLTQWNHILDVQKAQRSPLESTTVQV